MLNNLPMNVVVVGKSELEQFVKAWLVGTNGWLDGSERDKENEWNDTDDILQARYPLDADEAREKFEGMAEYTE